MTRSRLLVVDDDATLRELLADYLHTVGHDVTAAGGGEEGLRLAAAGDVDLVLLDVVMPGVDGWTVCERLRRTGTVPVILLTAKDMELDKLRGFRLGVDDYVTKPFSFAELAARIGAVLARSGPRASPELVRSDDLEVSLTDRAVTVGGRPVPLTPAEFRLVEALARRIHRPVPVEQLRAAVRDGRPAAGDGEPVKHLVWSVRRKLEADPARPRHLSTVRGYGYRLD